MTPPWARIAERIGRELRELREERGWTQQQLAERSGVAQQNVSLYERGAARPRLDTLSRLLDVLDAELRILRRDAALPGPTMSMDELLGYIDREVARAVERERRQQGSSKTAG